MTYDPDIHHRRSIRLQGYDYSQAGAYFVTLCAQNRKCLFGDIVDGAMRVNDAGLMAGHWYRELENKFPGIQCDAFVCMPNHVHFVVVNIGARPADGPVGADLCVRPGSVPKQTGRTHRFAPTQKPEKGEYPNKGEHIGPPLRTIVQWFKIMTTNDYIRGVRQSGWPAFPGKLWQRNYWEHVVRDETDWNDIREYIQNNPARWEMDKLFVGQNDGP
jgi:REP element-mobilizing transposase RayT